MNHYLRLVDQPMQIRFMFRKNRGKNIDSTVSASTPGGIYVILILGTTYNEETRLETGLKYGPYATPIETRKGLWDKRHSGRLTGTEKAAAQELNRQINDIQIKLETIHANLERKIREEQSDLLIDGPMVIDYWKKEKSFHRITLAEVYSQFLLWKKSMIEPNRKIRKPEQIALGTYKTYAKRWVLIEQFLLKRKQGRLPVVNVEYATAVELKEWLAGQKTSRASGKVYDTATISKVIKLLKMLLTYAQSKRYVKTNVLATFSMASGSTPKPKPLSRAQMNQLETCELPPALRHQCDSWLVAAELCLHYADYQELPQMDLVVSETGKLYIQHERSKQSGSSLVQTVNLTPRAIRLLEKYGGPGGLYYASSAYWSKQLKTIAKLAGIQDKDGSIMPLQFGQGRDTGLTRRSVQGGNNLVMTKLGGWRNARYADYYVDDAVGIVDGFASTLSENDQD